VETKIKKHKLRKIVLHLYEVLAMTKKIN